MGTHPIFESDFDCLTECFSYDQWWSDQIWIKIWTVENFLREIFNYLCKFLKKMSI